MIWFESVKIKITLSAIRKIFLLILFFSTVFLSGSVSQILNPATWSVSPSTREVKVGQTLDIVFNITIDNNWYLYSSDFDPDLGPMVTEFVFEPNDTYERIGEIKPINPKKKYDELWEGEYTYFVGKGQFRQTVRVLKENVKIEGSYSYQVCSDIDGKCIPFDDEFIIDQINVLADVSPAAIPEEKSAETKDETGVETEKEVSEMEVKSPLIPVEEADIGTESPEEQISQKARTSETEQTGNKKDSLLKQRDSYDPYTLLSFMIVAFLGGLAALFTPCVFPMIPMTVTFFTGRSKTRARGVKNALIYGLSIILIYTIIGSVIAPFMGPEIANVLATHWLPNVIFFLVFLIFALSFFGLFEINLPTSFVNKMDRRADKGGLIGIFFMAFTLVLVRFPAPAPSSAASWLNRQAEWL